MFVQAKPHWDGDASRYASGLSAYANKPTLDEAAVIAAFANLLKAGGIEFMRAVVDQANAGALPRPEREPATV